MTIGSTTWRKSRTTRCSMVSGPKGSSAFDVPIRVDFPPASTMPPAIMWLALSRKKIGARGRGGEMPRRRNARGMTATDFRRIALNLDGAEEGAHMGAADFRVGGRIFATLASQAHG